MDEAEHGPRGKEEHGEEISLALPLSPRGDEGEMT